MTFPRQDLGGETELKVNEQIGKSGQTKKKHVGISVKERPSRSCPMKVVVDDKGNPWICECDVDPSNDLAKQGCWHLSEERLTPSGERRSRQK